MDITFFFLKKTLFAYNVFQVGMISADLLIRVHICLGIYNGHDFFYDGQSIYINFPSDPIFFIIVKVYKLNQPYIYQMSI